MTLPEPTVTLPSTVSMVLALASTIVPAPNWLARIRTGVLTRTITPLPMLPAGSWLPIRALGSLATTTTLGSSVIVPEPVRPAKLITSDDPPERCGL